MRQRSDERLNSAALHTWPRRQSASLPACSTCLSGSSSSSSSNWCGRCSSSSSGNATYCTAYSDAQHRPLGPAHAELHTPRARHHRHHHYCQLPLTVVLCARALLYMHVCIFCVSHFCMMSHRFNCVACWSSFSGVASLGYRMILYPGSRSHSL